MAEKKGEASRMLSWAAKRRAALPMERVIMGELRLLFSLRSVKDFKDIVADHRR